MEKNNVKYQNSSVIGPISIVLPFEKRYNISVYKFVSKVFRKKNICTQDLSSYQKNQWGTKNRE